MIRDAIAAKKYKSGTRETLGSIKGSKLLVLSKSIGAKDKALVEEQAKTANVPIYQFDGSSVQLGKLCNKPYRITAIAIKSGTTEEIDAIMSGKDSSSTKSST